MKQLSLVLLIIAMAALFIACGKDSSSENGTPAATEAPSETPATPTEAPAADTPTPTAPEEDPTPTPTIGPHAKIDTRIPTDYSTYRLKNCGEIVQITYETKDYLNDQATLTKPAYVYLPPDYDETKQYNVLYLMHGIGGDETEWGMTGLSSTVKAIMDNLIRYGDIEPFIVVAPNGRSYYDFANKDGDYASFYVFGQELRNDLIPYIESNFAVYHDDADPTAVRDHRAMAGLSMGGMQTINIGMCECLDIISWFGTFSAAPTSYTSDKIASIIDGEQFAQYKINYMYNICGLQDNIAYASASAAAKNLPKYTDKLVDGENFMWQEKAGNHDFNIWYLGFYNFAQLAFKTAE
ncbi:MAG: hypothetical protein IK055_02745 [Lachnospiraceae bacterium]|nr:hypothetical protein [Lachnospiraceae bacterium]MBR6019118.1 hypothetical protein [Lachnospiraceae bacterium]